MITEKWRISGSRNISVLVLLGCLLITFACLPSAFAAERKAEFSIPGCKT
jgi:hypothetical protein